MALSICRECQGELSTEATVCPHCGCPLASVTRDDSSAREISESDNRTRADFDSDRLEDVAKAGGREIAAEAGSRVPLPRSVRVLGSLYLLVGGLALIETIWAAFQGTFCLSIGVIAIPLGVGLLRRSPAWRKLALCAAVVQILVIGLLVYILYLYFPPQFDVQAAQLSRRVASP